MSTVGPAAESSTNIFSHLIKSMGWTDDVNFEETPERVGRYFNTFTTRKWAIDDAKSHMKTFPTTNDQMLVQGPIICNGLCPHHLLPITYEIWIGILLTTKALGLSKYSRVCKSLSRYPFIQEDFTDQLAHLLDTHLNSNGTIAVVKGDHLCMKVRGVEQTHAHTITNCVTGRFLNSPPDVDPKTEFFTTIQGLGFVNH